jgi:hypothetical protein
MRVTGLPRSREKPTNKEAFNCYFEGRRAARKGRPEDPPYGEEERDDWWLAGFYDERDRGRENA